ncbi:MAG: hypothetical protein RSD76_08145, partial [Clostridia bacterium]
RKAISAKSHLSAVQAFEARHKVKKSAPCGKNILPIARLSFLYFLVVFLIQLPNFVSFSN